MFQLVEIKGKVNEKGCIEIPVILLEQTGIRTGEEVKLLYLAAGEKDFKNESKEFLLVRAGEIFLSVQTIPMDADLDIVCTDRKIVILPTEDVVAGEVPEELLGICEELGIPKEKVNIVLRMTEEGRDEKTGV